MKKFTVISMVLVVAVFVGLVAYTASVEDFTPPYTIQKNLEDTKSWNKTVDDLVASLEEAGLVDPANLQQQEAAGVASEAWQIEGISIYYWDLSGLATNSAEYQTLVKVERDLLFPNAVSGDSVMQNGPFAFVFTNYSGDRAALEAVLYDFGRVETEPEVDDSLVWTMKLDDLAAYMEASGLIDVNDKIKVNYGAGEKVRSAYRYGGIVDIEYYDQTMMLFEPGSDACNDWESINATGTVVYVNGEVGIYYARGPFVLHFYHWNRDAMTDEEKKVIIDYFMDFCKP